jgi:tRNA threonylcarbamoyl adenosine modification protein YjeE
MGVQGAVRSPSYLLAKVHQGVDRLLVHADLYRVGSAAEVEDLGLDELAGSDGVIAVEWPGAAAQPVLQGRPVLSIHFAADGAEEEQRALECGWQDGLPPGIAEVLHAAAAR